jgi:uncharacterized protein YggE
MRELADGITVAGTGRVPVPPDLLMVWFGAEVTEPVVSDAVRHGAAAASAMVKVLRESGVAERDVQTTGASLYQAHDPGGQPRGWTATQDVAVRLRELDRAGDLVNTVLDAAGSRARLRSLRFDVDRSGERYLAARTEARSRAFADAQEAARQYADLAGRRLGVVLSVREGDAGYPPPNPMRNMAFASAQGAPVEQGELDVTTTVEVRWELLG